MQHWIIYFSGRVQGVGFRWKTQEVARQYAVAGYVMNLPDRRVILECEGDRDELSRFVTAVLDAMSGYVRDHTIDKRSAEGQFGPIQLGALTIRR